MYVKLISTTISAVVLYNLTTDTCCPRVISRSEWGAREPKDRANLSIFPPTHVVIHHSATYDCTTEEQCVRLVKSIQNYHMDTQGWDDIGYNFLVGGDGNVYEGRGWGIHGAHAPLYNNRSIGICFLGTFSTELPSESAINATQELISCGVQSEQIRRDYKLLGHRQASNTECPGTVLFDLIQTWPQWTPHPEN